MARVPLAVGNSRSRSPTLAIGDGVARGGQAIVVPRRTIHYLFGRSPRSRASSAHARNRSIRAASRRQRPVTVRDSS